MCDLFDLLLLKYEKKEKAEKNYLSERLLQLNDSDKELIESLTKKLEDRQNSKDDESLLPCVRVSDIKKEKKFLFPPYLSSSLHSSPLQPMACLLLHYCLPSYLCCTTSTDKVVQE